jgi:hypothetical protein
VCVGLPAGDCRILAAIGDGHCPIRSARCAT